MAGLPIPQPSQRILAYEQLGMGLYVHWGLFSQLEKGEWAYERSHVAGKTTPEEYKKLIETFTAEDFDADALAKFAKENGFTYITMTTKHHEGFALYDSCGINNDGDFDAVHSPAKRDLIREFVDACWANGIRPHFYFPTYEWFRDKQMDTNWQEHLDYIRANVELLCKNYGKIGGFMFDGNWSRPNADWQLDELYDMIHSYQPDAIIINNTGMSARGQISSMGIDAVTYEDAPAAPMLRAGMPKYFSGEMHITVNDHWGVAANDINYKSPVKLIEDICNCRKNGANILINIGLEPQGGIVPYQRELLKLVGLWMRYFGEAIYNGRPYVHFSDSRGFIMKSVKGDCLYIVCFDFGTLGSTNVFSGTKRVGWHTFRRVRDKIKRVIWMDNEEELEYDWNPETFCVNLTGQSYGTSFGVRIAKAELEK